MTRDTRDTHYDGHGQKGRAFQMRDQILANLGNIPQSVRPGNSGPSRFQNAPRFKRVVTFKQPPPAR